ncbi:hypothetical protein [Mesorhizobium sp. M0323]
MALTYAAAIDDPGGHLGLLHPGPPAIRIAQLFSSVQPLSGFTSMM